MHLSNGEAMTDSFPFWIRVKDEAPNCLRLVYALRADPNNPYRLIVTPWVAGSTRSRENHDKRKN